MSGRELVGIQGNAKELTLLVGHISPMPGVAAELLEVSVSHFRNGLIAQQAATTRPAKSGAWTS